LASLISDLTARFPNLDASDVTTVVDTDLDDGSVNAFLNMAYYRTRPLAGALSDCGGKSMEEQIVILLAAHFAKVMEGDPVDEWVGREWRVKYRGTSDGEGLRGGASSTAARRTAKGCAPPSTGSRR